eukprot:3468281-Ditylum_brightwellii.AAC.1
MAAPDSEEFEAAIVTEFNGHLDNNHWELTPISQVPNEAEMLDSVQVFKQKRDIASCASPNGRQDLKSMVVSRHLLWMAIKADRFFMAYTQAPPDFDMCMMLPHSIEFLKQLKNFMVASKGTRCGQTIERRGSRKYGSPLLALISLSTSVTL